MGQAKHSGPGESRIAWHALNGWYGATTSVLRIQRFHLQAWRPQVTEARHSDADKGCSRVPPAAS